MAQVDGRELVMALERVFVSAGRRGLEIALRPADLIEMCQAKTAAVAR